MQLLYVDKQKDYVIELLKKCSNVLNNTVVPVNQDLELNDFGIFVGSHIPTISNRIQEQDMSIQNYSSVDFGDLERNSI